jgi:hypothetical protein
MGIEEEVKTYTRSSKLGQLHTYSRKTLLAIFRCDNCDNNFKRPRGKMDPKRLSNNYFHCCSNCNSKQFAQQKGTERKKIWDLPASSLKPIGKI